MRDWDEYVRGRLPLRDVEAHREGHIVEELATQLEDIYREARSMGRSESEADAITREHITDWDALAADIRRQRRAIRAPKAERWLESSEQVLRRRGGGWLSAADMLQELGFAFRRLRKSVGFSAVVLTTLAVGIGANTVIFSLVNGVLLRPLAYENSERLVSVRASLPNVGQPVFAQSAALHLTYQDRSRVFEDIGLWTGGTAAVTGLDEATNEWLIRLTESTFRVLTPYRRSPAPY